MVDLNFFPDSLKAPQALLTYSLSYSPAPITANSTDSGKVPQSFLLTIVAENSTANTTVQLKGLQFQIPVGDLANDLTSNGSAISPVPPMNWQNDSHSSPATGLFVVLPNANQSPVKVAPGGSLVFQFQNVQTNTLPGAVKIAVSEWTVQNDDPPFPVTDLNVTKFQYGWGTTTFYPSSTVLAPGAPLTLYWNSSNTTAKYSLQYYAGKYGIETYSKLSNNRTAPNGFSVQNDNAVGFPPDQDPNLREMTFNLIIEDNYQGQEYKDDLQLTIPIQQPGPSISNWQAVAVPPQKGQATVELSWQLEHTNTFELLEKAGQNGTEQKIPNVPYDAKSWLVYPKLTPTTYRLVAMNNQTNEQAQATANVTVSSPVPVGTICSWYAKSNDPLPDGWLLCVGGSFNVSKYPELQSLIGTTLPDLRGYFLRGIDPAGTVDKDAGRIPGDIQQDALKSHSHTVPVWHWHRSFKGDNSTDSGKDNPLTQGADCTGSLTSDVTGSVETRPVNVAVNYIIYAGTPATS